MHTIHCPDGAERAPRPRANRSPWVPVAVIAAVLGAASLASALTTDTRDFKARHGTVLTSQAL